MAETAFSTFAPEAQESAICIDEARWGAAKERCRLSELRFNSDWDTYNSLPNDHADKRSWAFLIDQSSDESQAAKAALLDTPAPNLAALRWKLEQIITFTDDDDEEFMDAWAKKLVVQTIADYKRLLPEAA